MILLAAVLFAFIVALITGGKLSRLADLPLRMPWLALLGFGLQLYMIYRPPAVATGFFSAHTLLLLGSYVILLGFVWLNRHIVGILVVGLGLVLNLSVMVANGGYMPITMEALARVGHLHELQTTEVGARPQNTKDIVLPREETNLWILSDVFVLPPPFPIPSVFSVGDVFLALGAFVIVVMQTHRQSTEPPP